MRPKHTSGFANVAIGIIVILSTTVLVYYAYTTLTLGSAQYERDVHHSAAVKQSSRTADSVVPVVFTTVPPTASNHSESGWSPPELPDHLKDADQKDPELIRHIRDHWIIHPFTGPRDLPSGAETRAEWFDFSEQGQPKWIDKVLSHRRGGFVVECGAADGLITSNSLWFELHRNWSGILIEANPVYFPKLLQLKRHMYMLNACLSPTNRPEMLNFTVDGIGGGISDLVPDKQQQKRKMHLKKHKMTQCFPLYSVLAAIDTMHVDFFSLDVEGAEISVLKTIPFDDVTIDSFSIEKRVVNDPEGTKQKTKEIVDLLSKVSFKVSTYKALDIILVRSNRNSTGP